MGEGMVELDLDDGGRAVDVLGVAAAASLGQFAKAEVIDGGDAVGVGVVPVDVLELNPLLHEVGPFVEVADGVDVARPLDREDRHQGDGFDVDLGERGVGGAVGEGRVASHVGLLCCGG